MQRIIVSSGAELGENVGLDEDVLRHVDVAEVPRDVDVLAERAADEAHLAPVLERDVDRLLHAVDVGGERCDEDAAAPLRDDLAEDLPDRALGLRHAGPLGVRGVAEEEVDAAVAEVCEGAEVGAEAVHGRVVDLVVAGVDDAPARGLEDDRHRVRDRVRHAHELGRERPDLSRPVLRHGLDELGVLHQAVLVELRLDEPEREPRGPDLRDPDLPQRYGSAPTWSSWPCVRTTARMSLSRSWR